MPLLSALLRKVLYYFSLMTAVVLLAFVLFHAIPSDPARLVLGPYAAPSQVEAKRKELGLDKPLPVQFFVYVGNLTKLDLGRSFVDRRLVWREIAQRLPATGMLLLSSTLILVLYLLVTPALLDRISLLEKAGFVMVSTPSFLCATIVVLACVHLLPGYHFAGTFRTAGDFLFFVPPGFVLALFPMGILSRILSANMRTAMRSGHILALRSAGVPEVGLRYKYALRNALVPCLAAFSNHLPSFFTGAFVVEIIFSIQGIGELLLKSVLHTDFPMIEGLIIVNGVVFVVTNLAFELLYPVIDPRIRPRG